MSGLKPWQTDLIALHITADPAAVTGEPVAEHTDFEDAAQTVTVEGALTTPITPTTPGEVSSNQIAVTGGNVPTIALGVGALLLTVGVLLVVARRRAQSID